MTAHTSGWSARLRQPDVGDIRTTDDGTAVTHVKGKGGKERSLPIEAELLSATSNNVRVGDRSFVEGPLARLQWQWIPTTPRGYGVAPGQAIATD